MDALDLVLCLLFDPGFDEIEPNSQKGQTATRPLTSHLTRRLALWKTVVWMSAFLSDHWSSASLTMRSRWKLENCHSRQQPTCGLPEEEADLLEGTGVDDGVWTAASRADGGLSPDS